MSRGLHRFNPRLGSRSVVALAGPVAVSALLAGFLAGIPAEVPSVRAVTPCQTYNGDCLPGFRTAAVDVTHGEPGASVTPVEPDTGESWTITGHWNTQVAADLLPGVVPGHGHGLVDGHGLGAYGRHNQLRCGGRRHL